MTHLIERFKHCRRNILFFYFLTPAEKMANLFLKPEISMRGVGKCQPCVVKVSSNALNEDSIWEEMPEYGILIHRLMDMERTDS